MAVEIEVFQKSKVAVESVGTADDSMHDFSLIGCRLKVPSL